MAEQSSETGRGSTSAVFTARVHLDGPRYVVEMLGELDLANSGAALDACTSIDLRDVVVDLSGLEFMNCAGYGALVASTKILEDRGGSLVLMNPGGEPQRLLAMIEDLELALCAPLAYDTLPMAGNETATS